MVIHHHKPNPQRGCKFRIESPDQQDRRVDISNSRRGEWFRWPARRKFSSRASQIKKADEIGHKKQKAKHNLLLFQYDKANKCKAQKSKRKKTNLWRLATNVKRHLLLLLIVAVIEGMTTSSILLHKVNLMMIADQANQNGEGRPPKRRRTSGWQWIKHGDLNREWRRRRLLAAAVW